MCREIPQTNWCSSSSSSSVPSAPATPDNSNKNVPVNSSKSSTSRPTPLKTTSTPSWINYKTTSPPVTLTCKVTFLPSKFSSTNTTFGSPFKCPSPWLPLFTNPGKTTLKSVLSIRPARRSYLLEHEKLQATSVDGKIERYSMATFINNPDKNSFTLTISTNASNHLFFKCN